MVDDRMASLLDTGKPRRSTGGRQDGVGRVLTTEQWLTWRVLVSWLFWVVVFWVTSEFIAQRYLTATLTLAVLAIVFVWLGFRTSVAGPNSFHRRWGHVTHTSTDWNDDGHVDAEGWYSWVGRFPSNKHQPLKSRHDFDYDGRWDAWADHRTGALRVDTDGDGTSDRVLHADAKGFEDARRLMGVDAPWSR